VSESNRNLLLLLGAGVVVYFLFIRGRKPAGAAAAPTGYSALPGGGGGGGTVPAQGPAPTAQPDPWGGAGIGALLNGLGGLATGVSNIIGASTDNG